MNQANLKYALLIGGGIIIGIALTVMCMRTAGEPPNANATQVVAASKVAHPPGAVAAQTPQAALEIVSPQKHVTPPTTPVADQKHPHDWVTPADLAKENGAAVGAAAASNSPQYKSSHQTYYVYGGDGSIPDHSALPTEIPVAGHTVIPAPAGHVVIPATAGHPLQTMTVETNYVYTNCVDPPSVTRGRYYRKPMVH
jgi:hypothetical protein